ncbi:hypothetical protein AVEN_110847-1, partial [Araneus ventricosus]
QCSAVLEELSKERPYEDESDSIDLDGDVTEYSDQETDSEMDVEQSSSRRIYRLTLELKCVYNTSIETLILLYHEKYSCV